MQTETFTPDGAETCYVLRVPTLSDKFRLPVLCTRHGLQQHSSAAIRDQLLEAAKVHFTPEEVVDLHEAVDVVGEAELAQMAAADRGETAPEVPRDAVNRVEAAQRQLFRLNQPLCDMIADNQDYSIMASLLRLRFFLVGIDGQAPFARDGEVACETAIEAIPMAHVGPIGTRIFELMQLSADQAKN
jgi:hypothetical protein